MEFLDRCWYESYELKLILVECGAFWNKYWYESYKLCTKLCNALTTWILKANPKIDFQYWIMNNGGDDAESMLQNRIKVTT